MAGRKNHEENARKWREEQELYKLKAWKDGKRKNSPTVSFIKKTAQELVKTQRILENSGESIDEMFLEQQEQRKEILRQKLLDAPGDHYANLFDIVEKQNRIINKMYDDLEKAKDLPLLERSKIVEKITNSAVKHGTYMRDTLTLPSGSPKEDVKKEDRLIGGAGPIIDLEPEDE